METIEKTLDCRFLTAVGLAEIRALSSTVRQLIEEGWEPLGPIALSPSREVTIGVQTMIKVERKIFIKGME